MFNAYHAYVYDSSKYETQFFSHYKPGSELLIGQ